MSGDAEGRNGPGDHFEARTPRAQASGTGNASGGSVRVPAVIWTWLQNTALAERHRWPLWLPVALGTGTALYFAAPFEPPLWLGMAAGALFLGFAGFAVRQDGLWRRAFLALLAATALGFATAKLRETAVATPILERPVITHLTGRVVALDWGRNGLRAVIDQVRSGRLPDPPTRIRVLIRKGADKLQLGAGVGLTAQLMPRRDRLRRATAILAVPPSLPGSERPALPWARPR